MLFVTMVRFRKRPTKETINAIRNGLIAAKDRGVENTMCVYLLGRHDIMAISEAPDVKTFMKAALRFGDYVSTETLVAIPAEEIEDEIE